MLNTLKNQRVRLKERSWCTEEDCEDDCVEYLVIVFSVKLRYVN